MDGLAAPVGIMKVPEMPEYQFIALQGGPNLSLSNSFTYLGEGRRHWAYLPQPALSWTPASFFGVTSGLLEHETGAARWYQKHNCVFVGSTGSRMHKCID